MIKAVTDRLTENNAGELDMLVSAVNPSDFAAATEPFLPLLKDGATVLDFSGTKRGVVCEMRKMAERFKNLSPKMLIVSSIRLILTKSLPTPKIIKIILFYPLTSHKQLTYSIKNFSPQPRFKKKLKLWIVGY